MFMNNTNIILVDNSSQRFPKDLADDKSALV